VRVIAAQMFAVSASGAVHSAATLGVPTSVADTPRGPGSQAAVAARRGEPVLVADWSTERTFSAPGAVHGLAVGATLAIPLTSGEDSFVLELHAHSPRAFHTLQTQLAAALLHVPPLQAVSELFASAHQPEELVSLLDRWIAELDDRSTQLSSSTVRDAMLQDRILLFGQPILDLRNDQVMKTELLVRMRGENGAVLAPERFMAAAVRGGLMGALDRWVLERACRLAATGQRVQMNVAARTMSERGFVETTRQVLAEHDAAPHNLTFGVSETELVKDLGAAQASAERLVRTGCAFALDDFGTGFAPLM
jgi:EAL domain